MRNATPTLGPISWTRRLLPAAIALGLVLALVFAFSRTATAQSGFAQSNVNPLAFGNIYPVTGDYVVAGAYGMDTNIANGFTTGTINVPDANPATGKPNPGITGRMAVPVGADIVLAVLYWQTVEKIGVTPGGPGSGQNGTFRPLFTPLGKNQPRYPISGVDLMPQSTVSFSNGGCTGGSTGKVVRTYRADVRGYLPQVQGKVSANGSYEVRLPSSGSTTPITLGATLVIIYRVLDQAVPPNMVTIFDGSFAPGNTLLTMTQTIGPFYDATHDDKVRVSRVTQIVGSGHSNKFETAFLNGVALPPLYASGQPFPGYYGGFDNTTWTFDANKTYVNLTNPVNGGDSYATSLVAPATSQQGCVSWGAIIFSTTFQSSDGDGLADVWKAPPNSPGRPGYCDASVNGGVCIPGSPSWVDLPRAKPGQRDVFMQLDYMCSTADGSTCDGRYSFDPRLAVDVADGRNAVQKVVDSFADVDAKGTRLNLHRPINLHVIPGNAIPEPTCLDANNNNVLCGFHNQPGAVGWPGGILFLQNQLVDPTGNASVCTSLPTPANCGPRLQQAKNISHHYGVFAHSVGLPQWTLGGGSLTSVVQVDPKTVEFTTSTPHGLTNDPSCANDNNGLGRVTVAFAISNANLNETFCVTVTGPKTFRIPAAGPTNFTYTAVTDPNLVVAPGQTGTISGFSDKGGQHSLFTLGNWGDDGKSWQVVAGTLMHEIGHELGLGHGGGDDINCKANYQSVMSYSRQVDLLDKFTGFDQNGNPVLTQVVDYSGQVLNTLNEGVSVISNPFTITPNYFTANWYLPTVVGSPATQHCDGTLKTPAERMSRVTDVTSALNWAAGQDINFDGKPNELLQGFDDWNSGINLPQGPATGVFSSAGGVGAIGGLGGVGLVGGNGGVGIVGGSGGVGAIGGLGGVGITGGNGGVGAVGGLGGVGAVGGNGGVGVIGGNGGVPELTQSTANSITRVPQRLTATEGVSPRTITLDWFRPNFGQIGAYNVYRSEAGGAFTFLKTVPVVNNPPEITTTDTVTCDPGGFRYEVSALLAPDNTQESQRSNIAPAANQPLVTGCYALTGGNATLQVTGFSTPAAGATFIQGDTVSITGTVNDDFYAANGVVPNASPAKLIAIGPLPHDGACPTLASVPVFLNGNYPPGTFAILSPGITVTNSQFAFNWNTTPFLAGCWVIEADFDSGQVERTEVQLDIFVSDSAPYMTTTTLPDGVVGTAYNNALHEAGGVGPFTWTVVSGSLPPGFSVQPISASGVLSGTPTAPGIYKFAVQITDSVGNFSQPTQLTLRVADAVFGDLVVVDGSPSANPLSGTLLRITPTGTTATIAAITTGSPTGVAVDATTGNIYAAVAPVGANGTPGVTQVTRFGTVNNFVSGGVLQSPVAVAVDSAGNVYVGDNKADKIYKYNSAGAQVDGSGNPTASAFATLPASPNDLQDIRMTFDSTGNLIVASDDIGDVSGQVEVDKIDATGAVTSLYNTTTNAALNATLTYSLTAASAASGGNTTYTGTFSPILSAGSAVTISGFTNGANNGAFTVVSCTSTTLVVNNPNGVAETNPGTATVQQPIGTVGGIAVFADGSIDVADFSAQAIFKITSPGAAGMAIMTATGPTAALCCNLSGMANPPSQVNTALYATVNFFTQLQLAVPETSSITTVFSGAPLTFPNDVAWYDLSAIRIDSLNLSSTTQSIGGATIPYTAALFNGTGATVSSVLVQAYINQGSASRAAGGAVVSCAQVLGDLPAGVCNFNFSVSASNSNAGTGILVPGNATARFELRNNNTLFSVFTVPVTLQ